VPSLDDEDREWIIAMLGKVKENLAAAWKIQRSFESNNVRPPRSGIEYGGLSVIDVSGLLQQALLLLGKARTDPGLVWEAFARADEIKGRFFQRDLAFSAAQLPDRVPVMVADALADLRTSLLSGFGDHRVVMAEFDRTIHFDMTEQDARRYVEETSFERALTRDDIRALLEADGVPSGFVSFYATPRETLVYLVTSASETPRVTRFEVDASTIEFASAHLQGDLRGYSVAGDDRVDSLLKGLRRLFEAMLPQLLSLSRIVISPHGPWHGIPLHAVLLPLLWQEGKQAGIMYVPSLRAWHLLQKRRDAMAPYGREPIALTTAPAQEDIEEIFAEEHRGVRAVLERTGRTVISAFGQEATLQRGLEDLRHCGVHHFLAHGVDAGSDRAMSSGLLLASDRGGLPSRSYTAGWDAAIASAPILASDRRGSRSDDPAQTRACMLTAALMMANGTTASHVTLQACSVGRPSATFRDELWGVTRALLAGGTNTVLAPLWDLDLRSSSQLVRRFYEHWLLHGQPIWLALASAQREMPTGSTEEFRQFSHWGALQLAGC
jgi:CHAT domain-containing protein